MTFLLNIILGIILVSILYICVSPIIDNNYGENYTKNSILLIWKDFTKPALILVLHVIAMISNGAERLLQGKGNKAACKTDCQDKR